MRKTTLLYSTLFYSTLLIITYVFKKNFAKNI